MPGSIEAGSILVESGTPMPNSWLTRGEPSSDGWILFRHPDRRELETSIDEAGLTFFYLAGEIKATVFGLDEEALMIRVVKKLIKNVKAQHWNGLEITRVAMSSFLAMPYATVACHARHIQKGSVLSQAARTPTKADSPSAAHSSIPRQPSEIADEPLFAERAATAWEDEGGAAGHPGGRLAA